MCDSCHSFVLFSMIGLISPKLQAHKNEVGEGVEMYLQKNIYTILDMLQPLEDNIVTL